MRRILSFAAFALSLSLAAYQHEGHSPPKLSPQKPQHASAQTVNVLVNNGKYSPSVINVKAKRMVHLNFKLGKNPGCGDTVVIKGFNIKKKLAKGKTTTVMFTPTKPGRYAFTCGMNMMKGTIVVK